MEPLLDTWDAHNRINHYLLDAIPDDALGATPPHGGRSVAEHLAHLHNVRLMWLNTGDPSLLAGLAKLERADAVDRERLGAALEASGMAIRTLVEQSLQSGGRIKGFKPHAWAFVGYLISHESHHRGQITLLLRMAGYPLDKKVAYGLWEWGRR